MTTRMTSRLLATVATLLAAGLVAASGAGAAVPNHLPPRVSTGVATHILTSSALLTGSVNPLGEPTSYYFRYGPTHALGLTTPTVAMPAGEIGDTTVKVGQPIVGLTAGATYYYRIVATNPNGVSEGKEGTFKAKGPVLAFVINRRWQDVYGTPLLVTGTLTGFGAAAHSVELQASPFPYLEPFTSIGAPATTNARGVFSFRVTNLLSNTQLRVVALDLLPVYSPLLIVQVTPRVRLHVKSSSQPGLDRVYGTITPAVNGAKVTLQVVKAVRPGPSEVTSRWVGQFTTVAKRGRSGSSRFSMIVKVKHGGRYRAFVKPRNGSLAAGPSTTTVVLHAAGK